MRETRLPQKTRQVGITQAQIRVYWYADRLEIFSPGGPVGIGTAETFGLPGYADYLRQLCRIAVLHRTYEYCSATGG